MVGCRAEPALCSFIKRSPLVAPFIRTWGVQSDPSLRETYLNWYLLRSLTGSYLVAWDLWQHLGVYVPGKFIGIYPRLSYGSFIVVVPISQVELLVGSSIEFRCTPRVPYSLVVVDTLGRLYFHKYACWPCIKYILVPLCLSQRGSNCGL